MLAAKFWVLILLLSPVEIPVAGDASPTQWQALKEAAYELQIVGPHETWRNNFRVEVQYVRDHTRELADAPALADADYLPAFHVLASGCDFNDHYQAHLWRQMVESPSRAHEWEATVQDAQRCGRIWYRAKKARNPVELWAGRRRALWMLREDLGAEALSLGQLPPCVPVWRFREIP